MKEQSMEQLLEHCLQEMTHTEDIEAILKHHPQEADDLRPLLMVALETSHYYASIQRPPAGLAEGRKRFLDAADRQRKQVKAAAISIPRIERKPNMKLALATKMISSILAVVMGTTIVGGGIVSAASGSLPGEPLYPVKLAVEDIRLELASTPAAQVDLALQFADERTAEVEQLTEDGEPVPEEIISRLERHINRALSQAAWSSEEEMPGLLNRIAQRTQTQAQVLERLQARVQEQSRTRLENAQRLCQRAHEEALAGIADAQAFRLRHQNRSSMPEDVTPPEPPTREPQNGGEGSQGGQGEPGQGPTGTPQGEPGQGPTGTPQREQQGNGNQGDGQQQGQGGPDGGPTGTPQGEPGQGPTGTPQGEQQGNGDQGDRQQQGQGGLDEGPTGTPQGESGQGPTGTPQREQQGNGDQGDGQQQGQNKSGSGDADTADEATAPPLDGREGSGTKDRSNLP